MPEAALAAEALAICIEKPVGNVAIPAHPDHAGCRLRRWQDLKRRFPQLRRDRWWPPVIEEHLAEIALSPVSDEVRAELASLIGGTP